MMSPEWRVVFERGHGRGRKRRGEGEGEDEREMKNIVTWWE